MSRIISEHFVNTLKTGILKGILEIVKSDDTLCLEIRNTYINIYYRGGSLIKIEEKDAGMFRLYFNRKYLDNVVTKVTVGEELLSANDPHSFDRVQRWIDEIPQIKHEMGLWFCKNPKEEREYQQIIIQENNYGGCSHNTDYYICDMEYSNIDGRFDMVAVKWPSKSSNRKDPSKLELAFIEMKYSDKALSQKSGICDHVKNMDSFLSKIGVINEIKKEMKEVFNLKIDLGLLRGIKKINSFKMESDDKPEYILLIANHDPDKTVLKREMEQLLISSEYASFKNKAVLKIATASYMGYGLYQECIFNAEEFISKSKEVNEKCVDENREASKNIGNKYIIQDIIDNLDYRFMSLEEYKWKCEEGILKQKKLIEDDFQFYNSNPDNPMASENRFVRINAADKLLRFIKEYKGEISEEVVDYLNLHLSDCCATVRQSIFFTLLLISNMKSLEFYKRLVYLEESPSTKRMLKYVINEKEFGKGNIMADPEIRLYLS